VQQVQHRIAEQRQLEAPALDVMVALRHVTERVREVQPRALVVRLQADRGPATRRAELARLRCSRR
jgi:hypothetical protein